MSSRDKPSTRATASKTLSSSSTTSKTNTTSSRSTSRANMSSMSQSKPSSSSRLGSSTKSSSNSGRSEKAKKDLPKQSTKLNSKDAKASIVKTSAKKPKEIDSKEMATTNCSVEKNQKSSAEEDDLLEQETNIDASVDAKTHSDNEDDESAKLLAGNADTQIEPKASHSTEKKMSEHATRNNARVNPFAAEDHNPKINQDGDQPLETKFTIDGTRKESYILYHDDEEINQITRKMSSDDGDDDDDEYLESVGAALTVDESSELSFVVYPMGCCEFDETQLISVNNKKAIQKCILRLSNTPAKEENSCWGLDQSQPILMRLLDDHIQFLDLNNQALYRSQPIQTIRSWAVDDDNNFAFVVEDRSQGSSTSPESIDFYESFDYALLSQPTFVCYVFRSLDDDDMSCRVAGKLNEGLNRYREEMSDRLIKSTRLQQMVEKKPGPESNTCIEIDEDDELEATTEISFNVKYIGKVQVPRPSGIDVLNVAIDKCLAEASKSQLNRMESENNIDSTLIEARLHVSPSSVIVENETTGEIIVECRIRYLTFMGISRRDIRWCGFIMQNTTNKNFIAHCFECHPTAGNVCDAIQHSCTKMYEKIVKTSRSKSDTISIVPTSSKLRDTLAKTLSRIKLGATILY